MVAGYIGITFDDRRKEVQKNTLLEGISAQQ